MLTVWGRKTSSNVQALMWCIGELALPYRRHDLGHRFGGLDTPEFRALNPNRTIPVLKDGDGPALWETGAILRYLADAYGDDSFWPQDRMRRAEIDKWADWAKLNVAMGFTVPIFWQVVRATQRDRDTRSLDKALNSFHENLSVAEALLSQASWLAGANFTLADIQFGHVLYRYFDIDIPRQALPNLQRYYQQLTKRAAFRRHVMISYEDLRVV